MTLEERYQSLTSKSYHNRIPGACLRHREHVPVFRNTRAAVHEGSLETFHPSGAARSLAYFPGTLGRP